MGRKVVVCLGNPLRADDGLGLKVGRELEKRGHKVISPGPDLTEIAKELNEIEELILVDAMDFGGEPGEIVCARLDELREVEFRSSTHTLSPLKFLRLFKELYGLPREVFIIGVQPGDLGYGEHLSPEVERAVQRVVEAISERVGNDREFED